jgi:shikimate 5-dehydrogenase
MRVFPKWAEALGLDAVMKGIDLPLHAPAEMYRQVTRFLKNDPLSLGALVTIHKLDLFHACEDMFDYIDPFARQLEEVSSLSKADGKFCAHAKDYLVFKLTGRFVRLLEHIRHKLAGSGEERVVPGAAGGL